MPTISSILILCDGNHCRSPIAEGLFKQVLNGKIKTCSAGLNALIGFPADPEACRLMLACDIPINDHRGRNLNEELAYSSDLILVMTSVQRDICASRYPATLGRIFLLGHWLEPDRKEIRDPYRQGAIAMLATLDHIQAAVATWLSKLKA